MHKYYIYFQKSNINKWYSKFLHKKISHVGLMTVTNHHDTRYFILNRYTENIATVDAFILARPETEQIANWRSHLQFSHVLLQNGKMQNNKILAFFDIFGIFNCVSLVKAYLGIKNPFIITPYQLYKYLIKHGGQQVWQ